MPAARRRRGRPAGSRVDPDERRTALLDAAERAIDIAGEAGFVRSAVYAMYPGRDALLAELSRRTAQRLLGEITTRAAGSTDLRQRMALFFDVISAWMQAEPNLYRALTGDPSTSVFEQLAGAVEQMLTTSSGSEQARRAAAPWRRCRPPNGGAAPAPCPAPSSSNT